MRVNHEADIMGIRGGWDLGHQRSGKELPRDSGPLYPINTHYGACLQVYIPIGLHHPLRKALVIMMTLTGESKVSSQLYSP